MSTGACCRAIREQRENAEQIVDQITEPGGVLRTR